MGGEGEGREDPFGGTRLLGTERNEVRFWMRNLNEKGNPLIAWYCPVEHQMFRSVLPRLAATCTESLTPFLAMLPCSSHAGLSSLLNPHKLFDGDWTLLGIHFVRESEKEGTVRLEVGSVVDPVRHSRLKGGLGSRGSFLAPG